MKHALKILDTSLFDLCYNSNFGPVLSDDEEEAERAEIEMVENDNANATDDEETDVLLDSVAQTENDPTFDDDESYWKWSWTFSSSPWVNLSYIHSQVLTYFQKFFL